MSRDEVLLLGGAGFIGRALAHRLATSDVKFHCIGRQNIAWLEQVVPRCSTVVHMASATTPGSSARHPELELNTIDLTLRLLALLQTQPDTHLIFFPSGGAVYGNTDRAPISEETQVVPISNYGAGKAAQELFCHASRCQGRPITIVRPSNAYGPGQSIRQGFGLIRTLIESARYGKPIEVWGDGENIRDYVYIDDIVEATILLINRPWDSETYNLGSGMGYSINQVREIVEAISGKKLSLVCRPGRSSDVRSAILDNTHISTNLGWRPSVQLPDGILRTWKWQQQA